MIIKNTQLNNDTINALNILIDAPIKASVAFCLMRIIKEISSLIDMKIKTEKIIFDKWVERDANNNPVLVYDENNNLIKDAIKIMDIESFKNEMNEFLNSDITIPYEKIKFDDLGLKDNIKISDLLKIDFIFE